jgi:predicted glycosyltransferase
MDLRIMPGVSVLFISYSIGVRHAARDLAIARELRRIDPSFEIMWLAGVLPVRTVPGRSVSAEDATQPE